MSAASPSAVAARRKAVPYSGPAAPPTLDIRVMAVSFRAAPAVSGGASAIFDHDRFEAAVHVFAVVRIADRPVQLDEFLPVLRHGLG